VIVSAMAGMTNDLIDVVNRAGRHDPHYKELADRLRDETTRSSYRAPEPGRRSLPAGCSPTCSGLPTTWGGTL
jgi:hypothetical protein